MPDTLHVITAGTAPAPSAQGLPASAWGSFELRSCDSLDDAAAALQATPADALWLRLASAAEVQALLDWPPLLHLALDTAVLVTAPALPAAAALPLLQIGVQDLRPAPAMPAEVGDLEDLARALRLAIERKRLEKVARKAWASDLSTGLPNHAQLLEHMNHLLALREREPAPMALIVLRLQGLARTEAALGAESANVMRRKAAVRLRAALRASDVVASIGVDAFAVLLAWIDSPQDGERVAAKLAHALARPFSVAGRQQTLGVSAGLASYPEHGKQADALLHRALAQAAQMATVGGSSVASSADRGPAAAANDED
jgi:diguanylate cyclase (GGDEF)-like protein